MTLLKFTMKYLQSYLSIAYQKGQGGTVNTGSRKLDLSIFEQSLLKTIFKSTKNATLHAS